MSTEFETKLEDLCKNIEAGNIDTKQSFESWKKELKQLVTDTALKIIGEDEGNVSIEPSSTFTQRLAKAKYYNDLRAEQRAKLKELGIKEKCKHECHYGPFANGYEPRVKEECCDFCKSKKQK